MSDALQVDESITSTEFLFRRVLVVTRDSTSLPDLPVEVLEDGRAVHGPLAGLARGLSASDAGWCFVVGCDMPLLLPAVIHRMTEKLGGCQILVPYLGCHHQTLHAYYSRTCLPLAEELLNQGMSSLMALHSLSKVRPLSSTEFLDIDPELRSFKDMDTVEDYEAALNLR